jgi:hypothetical protein
MWCPEDNIMTDNSPFLFNKSLVQLRLLGARGGKAYGRNQRARRALMPPPPAIPVRRVPGQTTAEAITLLDAQFPWLSECACGTPKGMKTRRTSPAESRGNG